MYNQTTYSQTTDHLPDPERQAAFYDGVTIKRGIAWIIDTVIVGLVAAIVATLTILGWFVIPFVFLMVGFVYRWFTIAGGSATWGMRVMAIEFRDAQGQRLDSGQAFMHTLGYTISVSLPLIQFVSVVMMFIDERGRGLSDMVLGTVALNRRA